MKCRNCNNYLELDWNFCPFCGMELEDSNLDKNFSREVNKLLKGFGFPNINVTVRENTNTAQKRIKRKPKRAVPQFEEKPRKVNKVVEPEAKVERTPSTIKIVIKTPGVKKASDIKVRKFNHSIEIRAYTKNKMYFKVIPIFKNSEIVENKFVNEMLKLVLANKS